MRIDRPPRRRPYYSQLTGMWIVTSSDGVPAAYSPDGILRRGVPNRHGQVSPADTVTPSPVFQGVASQLRSVSMGLGRMQDMYGELQSDLRDMELKCDRQLALFEQLLERLERETNKTKLSEPKP